MKHLTLTLLFAIALSSCSSNKQVTTNNFDPSNNPYFVKKEKSKVATANEVNDPKIQKKINSIIENHLGISISSIAISPITKKNNGYYWKFLNVRNGSSFTGFSDLKFNAVKIKKNNKKANTQVSDF
ncbi:hypothetical protein [Aquimarina litoralis]|uniref:hypothetical protein n=1 Tax=Aquimarina litoralis TaxID=584605 RepID=UPI001C572166|nr:hypothetical protein [Aquimarina litoralis]MBW1296147.1 hypothetical protein [Aquimarina litoralis]